MAISGSGRGGATQIGSSILFRFVGVSKFIRHQFWPFICAMLIMSGLLVGWMHWSAVIWFAKGDVTYRAPGVVKMHVTAYKPRQCQFMPNSELGYARSTDGAWREVAFKFVDDITPNSTRPRLWFERQSFGVWQWKEGEGGGPIESVMATVVHNCSGNIVSNPSTTKLPSNLPQQVTGYRLTRIGPMDATGPILN